MSFILLKEIQEAEPFPGFKGKFVHTENTTIAFWEITKDSILPQHNHIHEQSAIVSKGEFELTIEGKTEICKPGMIALIPSNAVHSGRALTYCEIIDVFSPVREDLK